MGRKKRPVSEEDREMGNRVREARERLGITVTDLGYAFGGQASGRQQVQFWEKGTHFPPASDLAKLCRLLRVDGNYLLGLKPIAAETPRDISTTRDALIALAAAARESEREEPARKAQSKSRRPRLRPV